MKCNWTKSEMNGVLGCFIMAMPFNMIFISVCDTK